MGKEFGLRLAELIKNAGLSQKMLAQKAGVTEAAMSHYVRGDRVPRANVMARIAEAIGTTSDYIMNGTSINSNEEIDYAKRLIARNVTQMSHEEKMEIVGILLGKK